MRAGEVGPAGLAVRQAVRRGLRDLATQPESVERPAPAWTPASTGPLVLVACSGGPDSLALAAATAFVAPRLGLRAGAVVVDHGLQDGSARVAEQAAATCRRLGLDPVDVFAVAVPQAGGDGPEAAARDARYAAFGRSIYQHDAVAVLLGHTRDDQAEAVLLGLLRGSGARSLSGMPARRGQFRRPLLDLPRGTTVESCTELGLEPWSDPHNADPAYTRSRVRGLLAELEQRIGAGLTAGLARTADLLRADDEALEQWAGRAFAEATDATEATEATDATEAVEAPEPTEPTDAAEPGALDCAALAALPAAVRTRVLRHAALAAGARPDDLTSTHLAAMDALVTDWHGQGAVALPGPVQAVRDCGRLHLARLSDTGAGQETKPSTEE